MIEVAGQWWATASEVADHIGQGVTEDNVRRWGARDGLDSWRIKGPDGRPRVWYALDQAVVIERAKRCGGRGRRRDTMVCSPTEVDAG